MANFQLATGRVQRRPSFVKIGVAAASKRQYAWHWLSAKIKALKAVKKQCALFDKPIKHAALWKPELHLNSLLSKKS